MRLPLNNTKTIFTRKNPKTRFLYFCRKMVWHPFNALCQLNPWGRSSLNHTDNRFSSKNWKNKFFLFFFKIIQYPFNGFFQINFYVRVPLNNTKNHFHNEKKPEKPIFGQYSMILWFFGWASPMAMLNIVDVQWMINRPTYHHTEP